MTSSMTYLMVLAMKKKMEGKIKFIVSQRFEKSIIGMIGFQMENKSVQCIFDKCPPESTKNKKFNFFGLLSSMPYFSTVTVRGGISN